MPAPWREFFRPVTHRLSHSFDLPRWKQIQTFGLDPRGKNQDKLAPTPCEKRKQADRGSWTWSLSWCGSMLAFFHTYIHILPFSFNIHVSIRVRGLHLAFLKTRLKIFKCEEVHGCVFILGHKWCLSSPAMIYVPWPSLLLRGNLARMVYTFDHFDPTSAAPSLANPQRPKLRLFSVLQCQVYQNHFSVLLVMNYLWSVLYVGPLALATLRTW